MEIGSHSFLTHVLSGVHFQLPGYPFSVHINYGVGRLLRKINPDVLISGGFAPANIAGCLYASRFQKKHFVWGELSDNDVSHASMLKKLIRKKIISNSIGAIASSSVARTVFIHYGMDESKILKSIMPIDVDFFSRAVDAFQKSEEMYIMRNRFTSPLLISIGRLVDSKGFWELFAIYARLLVQHPTAGLLIAGDGPQRYVYETYCRSMGWKNVHFLGFLQPEQLVKYMALVDLFIFQTLRDPFGAVVPEAMAAGIPVLSSIHAGATDDLIEDGVTGFRFDPCNCSASVSRVLDILSLKPDARIKIVNNALSCVQAHNFAREAAAIVAFCSAMRLQK